MNRQQLFTRKIGYLVGIVVLLLLLIVLGQPATTGSGGTSEGGYLTQLRATHGFSDAQLGEIDPASETLKLATVGLRGVAAQVLWEKANTYKMKKDWTNLGATLNQIAKLEPHFVNVWLYQGWNLSYNCSMEFDDYRERYRWVIKGVDYLQDGIRYNQREPKLVQEVARTISQKIGRADEWRQFRRLFKADDEFHGDTPIEERDNWLVGKKWYGRAEDLVTQGAQIKRGNHLLFYSHRPLCQMNYCEALGKDGVFDERAKLQWQQASKDWHDYGALNIPGTEEDEIYVLNEKDSLLRERNLRLKELERLAPGVREKIQKERYAQLTEEEKKAFDTPREHRSTRELFEAGMKAESKMTITYEQVAMQVTNDNFPAAMKAATDATKLEQQAITVDRQRQVVNFDYWKQHAEVEGTDDALGGRKAFYEAEQALAKGELQRARGLFEEGFQKWAKVLAAHPATQSVGALADDTTLARDLMDTVGRYRRVLEQQNETVPADFALKDYVEKHKDIVTP